MKKALMIGIVMAATGIGAGSAMAQPRPPYRSDPPTHHVDHRPMPSHWRHGRVAWDRHVDRCMKRYRSYDPRTDRYVVRRGVTRHCTL